MKRSSSSRSPQPASSNTKKASRPESTNEQQQPPKTAVNDKADATAIPTDGEAGYRVAPGHTSAEAHNVTELMSKKSKSRVEPENASASSYKHTSANRAAHPLNATFGRGALRVYTDAPASFPRSIVISHNEDFVTINDAFPKASVHLLILPRDAEKQTQHPYIALSDPVFLAKVREEAERMKMLAASELRRKFGRFSALDAQRNAALDSEADLASVPEPSIKAQDDSSKSHGVQKDNGRDEEGTIGNSASSSLPPGRDWASELTVGVHAVPSMTHLHIHIFSKDRHSPCLHNKRHYNSFSTPFLVPLADFPLAEDDERRDPGGQGYLDWQLKCWRCGRGFGMRFKQLKAHLEEEFDIWKKI